MDKHDRPYRCPQPECFNLNGFTYSAGLLRHEREVHARNGGPKGVLRCPVDDCKRHVGKAFSRMNGLVKHLGAVHGIKKSSAEVRRDYSFQSDSPDRKESVREHDNGSPGLRLQEDLAPLDYAAEFEREQEEFKMKNLELVNERRLLSLRLEQDDIDTAERHNLQDKAMQLMLLKQQNKKRMLMARQEHGSMLPQSATTLPLSDRFDPHEQRDHDMKSIWEDVEPRGDTVNAEDAAAVLRRHQAQVMTLEQQNKKRMHTARQEQDSLPPESAWYGQPTMPKDANLSGAGDDWWHASKYTKPLMQPRTTHNENVDQANFLGNPSTLDGSRLSWLPSSLLPSSSTRPNASALPTFKLPPPPLSKATAAQLHGNSFSQQSAPGFVGPELRVPGFVFPGVQYSPSGSDNADAGNITTEFARDNGKSRGRQAFLPTQQIDSQFLPHPNAQTDRPFRCDKCPQSFNRNHDLKRHKRIHAAVKPFPCDFCGKSFSRKEALEVRSTQISSR
jgi:hypothetical protein